MAEDPLAYNLLGVKEDIGHLKAQVDIVLGASVRQEDRLRVIEEQVRRNGERAATVASTLAAHEAVYKRARTRLLQLGGVVSAGIAWVVSSWDAIISFLHRTLG